jgi:hypothetical protein
MSARWRRCVESGVHHGDICDGDALRENHEDVPTSLDVGSGAIRCAHILYFIHHALDRLSAETEEGGEGCQGVEGPHGGYLGTLKKSIIRECDRAGQAHLRHLLQGLLQGQSKKQWP